MVVLALRFEMDPSVALCSQDSEREPWRGYLSLRWRSFVAVIVSRSRCLSNSEFLEVTDFLASALLEAFLIVASDFRLLHVH